MKPYAESCEQNRDPILEAIMPLFARCRSILEIGSGTGQHAVYFASRMPHLVWHTSDRKAHHEGIQMWLDEAALPNTRAPICLDVIADPWPSLEIDGIFSANTAHIMHWPEVEAMFEGAGALLPQSGRFALYGPFNYGGRYTSDSNARFDSWLKSRDPDSGIRNAEELNALADRAGMIPQGDYRMPANNRILCWERESSLS
ncbi:MAG: DUF938 domain-containing protein [Gammaproteobacteria bacterium]|nr:DUF938 domain-containing protein [Gammaproteobacteria bacterium]